MMMVVMVVVMVMVEVPHWDSVPLQQVHSEHSRKFVWGARAVLLKSVTAWRYVRSAVDIIM